MHLLLTDETNCAPSGDVEFFVYGGLIVPLDSLCPLHDRIESLRRLNGFKPEDLLKFDTRSRPSHVTIESFVAAKKAVIHACREFKCVFIVYAILHDILKNQPQSRQVEWAADAVIKAFDDYLVEVDSQGICAIDNLPNTSQWKYLSRKFQHGLSMQNGWSRRLGRIKLYTATCCGASHAASAMDVVLGSFRYCINKPKNQIIAKEMLNELVRMMWYTPQSNINNLAEKGLIFRPKLNKIKRIDLFAKYYQLIKTINGMLGNTELVQTGEVVGI